MGYSRLAVGRTAPPPPTPPRAARAEGDEAYAALEGHEVAMFDQRFAGVIDQFQVDHVGRVRNVSFRRLLIAK